MTTSLEKVFFTYILDNKNYFKIVEPHFFKNADISFVYSSIRNYMLDNISVETPKNKQIVEMVRLKDKDKNITKEILKSLLTNDNTEYNEEKFIKPKFSSWVSKNKITDGSSKIIDYARLLESLDDLDENKIAEISDDIKSIVHEATNNILDAENDTLGLDFDEAHSHIQDHSTLKVKTGWDSLDSMLSGGWDVDTLNILMGSTNSGKSLWLQNIAVKAANLGYNVVYFTLEMSEKKVLKRLGSMRLHIPISEYDEKSNDVEYIQKKIKSLYKKGGDFKNTPSPGDELFDKKLGKINVKFFAAGTVDVDGLDNHLKKLKEYKDFDADLIIVDYLTLMVPPGGSKREATLYTKGKSLAEGLRALGAKWHCPALTVMQVSKDAWNAHDITLDQVPESKAIAETADCFFAIIRTEEMKRNNIYRLKLLKQRDGEFMHSQLKMDLNPTYLTLEDDVLIDGV